MWTSKGKEGGPIGGNNGLVAVAIDKDKSSQNALKWAVDHLLQRGQTVILIHVKLRAFSSTSSLNASSSKINQVSNESSLICKEPKGPSKELFLPFRCFCTRKDVQCKDVMLEDSDVAKALVEYVNQTAIEILVVGSSNKGGFLRFNKPIDVPSSITKSAPDFCTVYVISKGKISTMRSAFRPAPEPLPQINSVANPRAERQSFELWRKAVDDSLELDSSRTSSTTKGSNVRSYRISGQNATMVASVVLLTVVVTVCYFNRTQGCNLFKQPCLAS